jgi:uncharacterized protein
MRVAVIGTGIAGSAAAWLISRRHDVQVFEAADRAGGHTDTRIVPGPQGIARPVDTGFIVYNETTYPLLVELFKELGVETEPSDMSWSLACERCELAYAGSLRGMFTPLRRMADRQHLSMLRDIARFNRIGRRVLADGTIQDDPLDVFLDAHGFGPAFRRHYLLPMAAAIWSSGTLAIERFPVRSLLTFLSNHGLLGVRSHLAWRTVTGGAQVYLSRLLAPLEGRIALSTPVHAVRRHPRGVELTVGDGSVHEFDAVVLAGHADDSFRLLQDPSAREQELLGPWQSSANERWLHTDATLLPDHRSAWASWNYHVGDCRVPTGDASLSYHMNRLQNLAGPQQVLVSINPPRPPRADTVILHDVVRHPTFDRAAVATQPHLDRLNGERGTYFVGAWQRWGFHEDGLWSAVRVAAHLGVQWPA